MSAVLFSLSMGPSGVPSCRCWVLTGWLCQRRCQLGKAANAMAQLLPTCCTRGLCACLLVELRHGLGLPKIIVPFGRVPPAGLLLLLRHVQLLHERRHILALQRCGW